MLQIRESKKGLLGREPVKRTHREIVVLPLSDSKLFGKVIEGIKLVRSIKHLVVFSMTTLYLAVVSGRERTDQLVFDSEFFQRFLEKSMFLCALCI